MSDTTIDFANLKAQVANIVETCAIRSSQRGIPRRRSHYANLKNGYRPLSKENRHAVARALGTKPKRLRP